MVASLLFFEYHLTLCKPEYEFLEHLCELLYCDWDTTFVRISMNKETATLKGDKSMKYYIHGESGNKIFHKGNCSYVKMIPIERRHIFFSLQEALKAGYIPCKHCSSVYSRLMRQEKKSLESFCIPKGICYFFNSQEGALEVISKSGKWKIVGTDDNTEIVLYHKNAKVQRKKGIIPGYHLQKATSKTLLGYMEYIANHDTYRDDNPLSAKDAEVAKRKKPGSKKWKKFQEKAEALKKRRDENYVMELLDNMSRGNISY